MRRASSRRGFRRRGFWRWSTIALVVGAPAACASPSPSVGQRPATAPSATASIAASGPTGGSASTVGAHPFCGAVADFRGLATRRMPTRAEVEAFAREAPADLQPTLALLAEASPPGTGAVPPEAVDDAETAFATWVQTHCPQDLWLSGP